MCIGLDDVESELDAMLVFGAMLAGAMLSDAGDILPGAVPGAAPEVTLGALAAPLGAGLGVLALDGALDIEDIGLLDEAGAMLPGAPEGVTFGAVTAPVGAGAAVCVLWAQAMPVVSSKAVEANHNERIIMSFFLNSVRRISWHRIGDWLGCCKFYVVSEKLNRRYDFRNPKLR